MGISIRQRGQSTRMTGYKSTFSGVRQSVRYPEEPFRRLDLVCLLGPVRTKNGEEVPANTFGTLMAVYADAKAYEVEFVAGLATVDADLVTAAPI